MLSELVGRAADMFATADGRLMHGSELGRRLQLFLSKAPLGSVGQVLFEQVAAGEWKVLVESADGFDEALAAELRGIVHASFGEACSVSVERVALVPREKSGKYRYYRRGLPQSLVRRGELAGKVASRVRKRSRAVARRDPCRRTSGAGMPPSCA